jgi:uncharacterized protein YgbK (DUF1537 family)
MTSLRLLADDLTGALDAAAEFVPLTGPVQTFWHGTLPAALPNTAALDSGTRELEARQAAATVRGLAPHLSGSTIAFKKIDSLLRGHSIAEIAACAGGWDYCVVAPAFPYHGRITRGGRQYVKHAGGDWLAAGGDLVAALDAQGAVARTGSPDADLRPGINVFDAQTDDDLRRVVTTVRRCPYPVLWCGTGGLAQALAAGTTAPDLPPLPRPILGVFGSDHATTAAQLAACEPHWTMLPDGGSMSAERIAASLCTTGIALVSFDVPVNTPRRAAAGAIARHIGGLTRKMEPPGTIVAAGGETLRSLCQSLGATSLRVHGRIVPGVPLSVISGGRWDGVTVVSKSGAFGHSNLLRELILERTAS